MCDKNHKKLKTAGEHKTHTQSTSRMDTPVIKLNDDCLREIFSYLSKRELIGIERVCKQWRNVALSVWSKQTHLNFEILRSITNDSHIQNPHLQSILTRCGEYLKSFKLDCPRDKDEDEDGYTCCETDEIIVLIVKYCKNLQHLSLRCRSATPEGLRLLENIASNLESFSISFCRNTTDSFLKRFLKRAPKLNSLCISKNVFITGSSLVSSKREFRELRIDYCDIRSKTLKKILDNSPRLEVLYGPSSCTFQMLNSHPIREHLVYLELLMAQFFKHTSKSQLLPFPNLRVLKLIYDIRSIQNQILFNFCIWFPNLESLNITGCENGMMLDNEGIRGLIKMPKLKMLGLTALSWLRGKTLVDFAKATSGRLERLECAKCNKLRDSEMIEFVSLSPNLTYLDLAECRNIKTNFLAEVLKLMPLRTREEPLTIRITRSRFCKSSEYKGKHPLLVIKEHETDDESFLDSDMHYDRDYDDDENDDYDTDNEDDDANDYENDHDIANNDKDGNADKDKVVDDDNEGEDANGVEVDNSNDDKDDDGNADEDKDVDDDNEGEDTDEDEDENGRGDEFFKCLSDKDDDDDNEGEDTVNGDSEDTDNDDIEDTDDDEDDVGRDFIKLLKSIMAELRSGTD